uniref:Ig-like domain-containing protein n=1 Tax=Ditylenchus dipsaci TaxID=166011 RepID=A0A915ELA9_9BILA
MKIKFGSPVVHHMEGTKWYDHQFDEVVDSAKASSDEDAEKQKLLIEEAESLLKHDVELYETWYRSKNRSDANWLESVSSRGTFADRISVVQLKVQRSPVHALSRLTQLVSMVQKKGLRESTSTLKVLKELFIQDLLPPNRKLMSMQSRPLLKYANALKGKDSNLAQAKKRLIMWKFEANLKLSYDSFVHALETMSGNAVEGVSQAACLTMSELLCERAEQEQFLLTALVNKLGHPCQKVGSKVSQMLEKLIEQHSNMRAIVVEEVKRLVFRKNVSEKAQYYAVHFLRRILLSAGESDLAFSLIQVYLTLFRIVIAKEQPDHKLVPLLIAGVNKAFPYAKGKTEDLVNEVESLYTLVQTSKLPTALNVLKLLFQIHNSSEGLSDRFYSSFYRRLLTVTSTSLDEQFFALIQKVIQNDAVVSRARAFIKRLFQISLSSTPAFAASALLICSMIFKTRPELLKLPDIEQTEVFMKINHEMPGKTDEKSLFASDPAKFSSGEDSEESDDGGEDVNATLSGWVHRRKRKVSSVNGSGKAQKMGENIKSYNPTSRNPLFAYADLALDVEIVALAKHYHPTVSAFAKCIVEGTQIAYDGDPLVDFSSIRFLDRFAFKNPKIKNQKKKVRLSLKKDGKESKEEEDIEDFEIDEEIEEEMEIDGDDEEAEQVMNNNGYHNSELPLFSSFESPLHYSPSISNDGAGSTSFGNMPTDYITGHPNYPFLSNIPRSRPLTKQVNQLAYELPQNKYAKNPWSYAPEFLKVFSDIRVADFGRAVFDCVLLGSPRPKVCWLFNDEKLWFEDVTVEDTADLCRLTIPVVQSCHFGVYTVLAENEVGRAVTTATLLPLSYQQMPNQQQF